MTYRLSSELLFDNAPASPENIVRALDEDTDFRFVVIEAPDGSFVQAAVDDNNRYIIEYRNVDDGVLQRSEQTLPKHDALDVLSQFVEGDMDWYGRYSWVHVQLD